MKTLNEQPTEGEQDIALEPNMHDLLGDVQHQPIAAHLRDLAWRLEEALAAVLCRTSLGSGIIGPRR